MKIEAEKKLLQDKIFELFSENFSIGENKICLSYPLIPRISEQYIKNRVLIIGQETNTWYNRKSDHGDYADIFLNNKDKLLIHGLEERYDIFVNDWARSYGGMFWQFSRLLYERNVLKGEIVKNNELSHCWINLFCMEACHEKNDLSGRPTKNNEVKKAVLDLQNFIVYELIKLLNPKLLIFLTGVSLDSVVFKYALNNKNCNLFSIDEHEIIEPRHAAQIVIVDDPVFLNCHIIRLYHPTYFMGYINGNKYLKNKLLKLNYKESVSSYYIENIIKYLISIK